MKTNRFINGFTLLEMLFVLSVLSIILLLTLPIHHKTLETETEKRFLDILHHDVLYAQSIALTTVELITIIFDENHYVMWKGNDTVLYVRDIPRNWTINLNKMTQISFTNKGTIRQAGTINIKTPNTTFNYICPLGKGRCYFG